MGDELAAAVLNAAVPEIQQLFKIVAYNPRIRGNRDPKDAHKKRHIREIAAHYGVSTMECILFDDDEGNVADTEGLFSAYKVDPTEALRLTPALMNAVVLRPPLSLSSLLSSDYANGSCGPSEVAKVTNQDVGILSPYNSLEDVSNTILTDIGVASRISFLSPANIDKISTPTSFSQGDTRHARTGSESASTATTLESQTEERHASSISVKLMQLAHFQAVEEISEKLHTRAATAGGLFSTDAVDDNLLLDFRADLSALSPILFSKEQLQSLPPTLTIAGGREVFIDDITCFYARIRAARLLAGDADSSNVVPVERATNGEEAVHEQDTKGQAFSASAATVLKEGELHIREQVADIKDRLLVAPVDLHVFPILWRHVAHRILGPTGLGWLFDMIFPYRATVCKSRLQALEKQYGAESAICKDPTSQSVHSEAADEAVQAIASFIHELRRNAAIDGNGGN
jgi:hypothetical protein